jgi:outer membrane lipoprotein-sorting protein
MADSQQTPQDQQEKQTVRKLTIVVGILLAAAALFGFLAYRMASRNTDDQQTISNAECEHVGEDLCRFFASWQETGAYTLDATSTRNNQTTEYTLRNDAEGNFRLEVSGDNAHEVIAVDNTVYTSSDSTWHEQQVEEGRVDEYRMENALQFSEPSSEDEAAAYTAAGTEACGDLTCFKYRIAEDGTTRHIWFDNEDYRLRRVTATNEDFTYDASVSYGDVANITAPPNPVALSDDQHIPPGSTEPQQRPQNAANDEDGTVNGDADTADLPATGDQVDPEEYRQWLEQRRANQQP